jgi:hypothetical protein
MSELRFKFLVCYLIAVIAAYFVKKSTYRIATKAIKEEKLSTGIYSLFPVQGKRAVELAQGHIRGVNVAFWFVVLFFPVIFILGLLQNAI